MNNLRAGFGKTCCALYVVCVLLNLSPKVTIHIASQKVLHILLFVIFNCDNTFILRRSLYLSYN